MGRTCGTTTCSDPPSSLCCKQHNALSTAVCAKDTARKNEPTSTSSAVQTDGNAGGEAASCDVEASGHHGSTAALSLRAHPAPVLRKLMIRQRSKEPPGAQTGCCATSMTSTCPCAADARGGTSPAKAGATKPPASSESSALALALPPPRISCRPAFAIASLPSACPRTVLVPFVAHCYFILDAF